MKARAAVIPLGGATAGQAMILAVLTMGGIFLAATVVAGILMTSQIRQATDSNSSTAAIAAADAGIEWALYCYTRKPINNNLCQDEQQSNTPSFSFSNGASVRISCFIKDGHPTSCGDANLYSILSSGEFNGASRILKIQEVKPFVPTSLP
ncbi:MAG: hypothetical protein HYY10_00030 [Candidatus Liptonbacteria bacterium]|nr:hypothetical protein [Candidatus Liptonbacteria bacterium]